jgi:hypothetical protein
MLPCPVKQTIGFNCPGCGMQRAIIELLQGNIIESFQSYPALLPLIAMFIFLALHLKFDYKHGALILKIAFIINAIIISLNYILNLIP